MYCPECGKKLDDESDSCKYCGRIITKLTVKEGASIEDPVIEDVPNNYIKNNRIFHDPNESLIDTLGAGFISSLAVQNKFGKSVLFLSTKRVYQVGKLFDRSFNDRITYSHGRRSVDLKEITGISYIVSNKFYRYFAILFYFILGIGAFLGAYFTENSDLEEGLGVVGIALFVIAIIALIVKLLTTPKWLIIEYAGGSIITNCNWYIPSSIRKFIRNISISKDRITHY